MEGGGHGEDKRIMMGLFFGSLGLLAVLSLRSLCNRKDECESNCAICTPVFQHPFYVSDVAVGPPEAKLGNGNFKPNFNFPLQLLCSSLSLSHTILSFNLSSLSRSFCFPECSLFIFSATISQLLRSSMGQLHSVPQQAAYV